MSGGFHVLDHFPWVGEKLPPEVREDRNGIYCTAACPLSCHRTATVRFWVGTEGNLLFTCWAGCPKLEILRAVGCSWKDCFPGGKMPAVVKQTVTQEYLYRDERGVMLYKTLRLEPGTRGRDKDFRQCRPKVGGGVHWNLEGVRRVLYRLPELLAADPSDTVFVVAGEKDADSLAALGQWRRRMCVVSRSEWLDSYSAVAWRAGMSR